MMHSRTEAVKLNIRQQEAGDNLQDIEWRKALQQGMQPRNRPMDLVDLNGMWPQFPDYLIEGNEAHRLLQAKFMSEISGGR